jgi:uncharacterized membrane protein
MEKSKVLLSAAVASLIAAGAIAKTVPAQANETGDHHEAGKEGCNGKNECKGHEGKADDDKAKDKHDCKGKDKKKKK